MAVFEVYETHFVCMFRREYDLTLTYVKSIIELWNQTKTRFMRCKNEQATEEMWKLHWYNVMLWLLHCPYKLLISKHFTGIQQLDENSCYGRVVVAAAKVLYRMKKNCLRPSSGRLTGTYSKCIRSITFSFLLFSTFFRHFYCHIISLFSGNSKHNFKQYQIITGPAVMFKLVPFISVGKYLVVDKKHFGSFSFSNLLFSSTTFA